MQKDSESSSNLRRLALSPLCFALALTGACSAGTQGGEESLASAEFAATGTLTISGRITGPTAAPLSGVKVTLSGGAAKTATTDANGKYSFTGLATAAYTITPSKTGLSFCTASASITSLTRDAVEDFNGGSTGCQTPTYQRKALVLAYDPNVTVNGVTKKLSAARGWGDPVQMTNAYRRAIESITNGRVKYTVAKTTIVNDIPVKADGFDYTTGSYQACLDNQGPCHDPDEADYLKIFSSQAICNDVNSGAIDEVWLVGGPYYGFAESRMAGPNAFSMNSAPLLGTSCNRMVPIMGFNVDHGLGDMVHDLLHRFEGTLLRVYGSWDQNRQANTFDKFGLVASMSPSYNYSGCGWAHQTPNSPVAEYIYDSTTQVSSYCDDFYNYPNLKSPASALKTITCNAWGCSDLGFYRYWLQHVPKVSGYGSDYKFADWWRYVLSPGDIALTDSASCSSEAYPDACRGLTDGGHGICNEYEWAMNGTPTGWAKLTWPVSRSLTSVTLYDRACPERVLAGHLEFSDGSANIAFGALEDTGITGTKISFAAKNLTWVKVVIDQTNGGNAGLSEIVVQ